MARTKGWGTGRGGRGLGPALATAPATPPPLVRQHPLPVDPLPYPVRVVPARGRTAPPLTTPSTLARLPAPEKRRAIGPPPEEPESKRYSPFDQYMTREGQGPLLVRSRDHFGHITAAVTAHLTPRQQQDLGLPLALTELAETVVRDVRQVAEVAFARGLDEGRRLQDETHSDVVQTLMAQVKELAERHAALEANHVALNQTFDTMCVEELFQPPLNPNADGVVSALEELADVL